MNGRDRASALPLIGRDDLVTAVEADLRAGTHCVLRGPAGIGKTRLANEVAQRLSDNGRDVQRLMASSVTSGFQFGALAPLGYPPNLDPGDVTMALSWYLAQWRQIEPGEPTIVWVDDAQHLDGLSAMALRHGVAGSVIQILLTHRTPEPLTADIEAMITDGSLATVDIAPLDNSDASELAAIACPRTMSDEELAHIVRLGAGRPLFLRELAVDIDSPGQYLSTGLDAQIGRRIASLSPAERRVVEMVAVAEPLPASILADRRDELTTLLGSGLVQLHNRRDLRLEHPLYSEWTLQTLGPLKANVFGDLLDAAPADTDPLLVVDWHVEAGRTPDPSLASEATRAALSRSDTATALRFVGHVRSEDQAVLEGQALVVAGEVDAGLELLESVYSDPGSPRPQAVQAASFAARFIGLVLGDQTRAHEILAGLDEESLGPQARRELLNGRMWLWMFGFGPEGNELDLVPELLDPSFAGDQSSFDLAVSGSAVSYYVYGTERATPIIERMRTIEESTELDAQSVARARAVEGWFHFLDGRAFDGAALKSAAFDSYLPTTNDEALSLLGGTGGLIVAMTGDIIRGCEMAEIAQRNPEFDWWRWKVLARLILAGNLCLSGRVDQGMTLLHSEEAQPSGPGSLDLEHGIRARAAYLADEAAGLNADGESLVAGFMELAATRKHLWITTFASELCDWRSGRDVLRFVEQELAHIESNDLTQTVRSACLARLDADMGRLVRVAEDFELAGVVSGASRAYADVIRHVGVTHEHRRAAIAGVMRTMCLWNGAPPAWLADLEVLPTDRQCEIAFAVAGGETAAAVADRLFLSTRTIQNHLYRTYRAMGINSLDELVASLAARVPPPGWKPSLV